MEGVGTPIVHCLPDAQTYPPLDPGTSWLSLPGGGLLSSSMSLEMETSVYLSASQFGCPLALPMRISTPGTQPGPLLLNFMLKVDSPKT